MATTVKTLTRGLSQTITKVLGATWSKWTEDITDAAVLSGVGTPVATVIGNCGDLYTDTNGLAGAVLFVKEGPANDGTTAGWRAL